MKFLVVDDDLLIRKLLSYKLSAKGYICFEAINGLDALTVLHKEKIDVIITDISMPEMDGVELVQNIRYLKFDIPVFAITAGNTRIIEEQFGEYFHAVYSKLVGMDKVIKEVIKFF